MGCSWIEREREANKLPRVTRPFNFYPSEPSPFTKHPPFLHIFQISSESKPSNYHLLPPRFFIFRTCDIRWLGFIIQFLSLKYLPRLPRGKEKRPFLLSQTDTSLLSRLKKRDRSFQHLHLVHTHREMAERGGGMIERRVRHAKSANGKMAPDQASRNTRYRNEAAWVRGTQPRGGREEGENEASLDEEKWFVVRPSSVLSSFF